MHFLGRLYRRIVSMLGYGGFAVALTKASEAAVFIAQ